MSTKKLVLVGACVVFIIGCYYLFNDIANYDASQSIVGVVSLGVLMLAMLIIIIRGFSKQRIK